MINVQKTIIFKYPAKTTSLLLEDEEDELDEDVKNFILKILKNLFIAKLLHLLENKSSV